MTPTDSIIMGIITGILSSLSLALGYSEGSRRERDRIKSQQPEGKRKRKTVPSNNVMPSQRGRR